MQEISMNRNLIVSMKIALMGLALICCLVPVHGGDWQWLQTAGGSNAEVPRQIAVDSAGNSYVAGSFDSSNCPFGNIILTNTLKAVYPPWDGFLAKYDTSGKIQWAVKFGGTNDDKGDGLAVDAQSNCYVTGWFESTNFYIGNVTLTNYAPYGNPCLFVAKYNSSGQLLWAQGAGPGYFSAGVNIVVDTGGNSYVAGYFAETNQFGGSTLASQGIRNIVLLKYDANGNQLWVKPAGGSPGADTPGGLALDSGNNIYLLANIRSTNAAFGNFTFSVAGTNGGQNIVVAKYDPSGNVLWAREYGGTSVESGTGIAVGPGTNCFFTGSYTSTNFTIGNTTFHGSGSGIIPGILVAVLNAYGNPYSAWAIGGDGTIGSTGIAADPVGNCYVAGFFGGTNLFFNSGWLSLVTLTNFMTNYPSTADAFVAKFDNYGNTIHVYQALGLGDQRAFSVAVDTSATPYATGWTMGTNVMFGSLAATNAYIDLFVGKLDPHLPGLQIVNGDITYPAGDSSKVTVSWPVLETGAANATLECSTDLVTWTTPNEVGNIYGGGNNYLIIQKPGMSSVYRLLLAH